MNLNDPQIWQALGAVVAAVGIIIGGLMRLQSVLAGKIERSREQSETGREKLYGRIETLQREIREGFVSRDTHASDLRAVNQVVEQLSARQDDFARRLDHQCRVVRARRADYADDEGAQ